MSGNKKRSFTVAFKLEAVEYALKNSSEGAARKYNVDSKRIREWRSQKNKLVELSNQPVQRRRLKGGGRHVFNERMEEMLAEWVRENRSNKVHVSRKIIQEQAQRFHNELDGASGQKFTASRGWLQRFLERNGFVKNKTTETQRDPDKIISKLVQHVMNMRQMRLKSNYELSNIIIMDEVLCSIECTNEDKIRFTVCLSAKGDGSKLMPYVVFASDSEDDANVERNINGVICTQNPNGSMNALCMLSWVQNVVGASDEKRLLVWDSYGYHVSHETIQESINCNIDLAIVPGGCTKYIHAPQVYWNERFKNKLKDLYNIWAAIKKLQTGTRVPDPDDVVQWIIEAWDEFPVTYIANSIKLCAITTATDGSEDDEIQCFKECEPYESGKAVLAMSNSALQDMVKVGESANFQYGTVKCEEQTSSGDDDELDDDNDEGVVDESSDETVISLNPHVVIKKEII